MAFSPLPPTIFYMDSNFTLAWCDLMSTDEILQILPADKYISVNSIAYRLRLGIKSVYRCCSLLRKENRVEFILIKGKFLYKSKKEV